MREWPTLGSGPSSVEGVQVQVLSWHLIKDLRRLRKSFVLSTEFTAVLQHRALVGHRRASAPIRSSPPLDTKMMPSELSRVARTFLENRRSRFSPQCKEWRRRLRRTRSGKFIPSARKNWGQSWNWRSSQEPLRAALAGSINGRRRAFRYGSHLVARRAAERRRPAARSPIWPCCFGPGRQVAALGYRSPSIPGTRPVIGLPTTPANS